MAAGPGKTMWVRSMVVMLVLLFALVVVPTISLGNIMIIQGEFYKKKAADQQLYDTEIKATRGDIVDRNGETLATSAPVWTVYITPNDFRKIEKADEREQTKKLIATELSSILGLEYEKVLEATNKNSSYVSIKQKVEKPEADKVRTFVSENSLGYVIGLDESTKRYYPNDNLASTVLGFVGTDNQGLSGLEAYYDNQLTGVPGRVVAAKNALGADMPFSYEKMIESVPGNTLVSTIDKYVQYVVEKHLTAAVAENKVSGSGICIVQNVKTGAILAMASKNDFNPNDPFTLSEQNQALLEGLEGEERTKKLNELRNAQWRNAAISNTYDPGSVFKVITVAAALEEGVTDLNCRYSCPGYIVVAGQRYKCSNTEGHGSQSLTEAMQHSCNPAFITIGMQLKAHAFSTYFEAFGLTAKTGIDLPGEASSIYHAESQMGMTELASSSFGQTFQVTPLQMITAISTAVNGGNLVTPYVVDKILDRNGNVIKSNATTPKRQVIASKTSETVRYLMEQVVATGGGKNAYISGYRIGGKTGTSQKVTEMLQTGQTGLYVASFVGVAPINDPEIAVLVMMDKPNGESFYGGTICAPVAGSILAEVLPYLGYEPNYTQAELDSMAIKVPDVEGLTLDEAKAKLNAKKFSVKIIGDGDKVVSQFPESSHSIYSGGTVLLYTTDAAAETPPMTTVPNMTQLTVSGVNDIAKQYGINVVYSGNVYSTNSTVASYKQSLEPGLEVEKGTVVTVYFRSEDYTE